MQVLMGLLTITSANIFAGNTSSGAVKPCTLETGVSINVPLFINIGDILKIDTRTGEYTGRVQN